MSQIKLDQPASTPTANGLPASATSPAPFADSQSTTNGWNAYEVWRSRVRVPGQTDRDEPDNWTHRKG